jgi:hypothetical protein
MPAAVAKRSHPSISDEAVAKATGRDWNEWFRELDAAGAKTLSHPEIVAIVSRQFKTGPWWRQMVTVEYERSRGLRVKHETAQGFSVSASKTYAAPVARVYSAWATAAARRRWLDGAGFTITTSTPNRSIRFAWEDGTRGDVGFVAKGDDKTQVAIGHGKLPNAAAAARMKAFWKEQLGSLQAVVER